MDVTTKERIVIIGGGFAGLNIVKRLDKDKWQITLVDKNNYHSFPPLFYQVASSGLDPGSISFPFRREIRKMKKKGVRFHMGEVKAIDALRREVVTQYETICYDRLIIAAGTTNNFFGDPGLEKYVFTLKSTPEAIRCRNEVLQHLERAATSHDPRTRRDLLSFVVVGGGPTGVEIAGALGEMKRYILPREYPDISPDELSITLIEGSDAVLRNMSDTARRQALEYLGHLMVDVRLGKQMTGYEDNVVTLNDGTSVHASMVIWTAGITGTTFTYEGKAPLSAPGGRIEVDEFNRVKGLDGVYAVGDIAYMSTIGWPHGHPQLAQVAIQQSRLLASQLNAGAFTRAFRYRDRGTMATVGRNRAVADLKFCHLYGRPAWLTWMFVHLISILGMRNKISVLINWIWAYFTYSTSLRLLFLPVRYPLRRRWGEK